MMDPSAIILKNIQDCKKYLQLDTKNFQNSIKNPNAYTMTVAGTATYGLLLSTLVPTEKKIYINLSNNKKASSAKLPDTVNLTGIY